MASPSSSSSSSSSSAAAAAAVAWWTRAAVPLLLSLICVLAVAVRLFPVAKWGVVIHEYDPHFNFRVTRLLRADGARAVRDWFDDRAWYPLGRSVGDTLFPGLMLAAVALQWFSETLLRLPLDTRTACVFVAPLFAAFACLAIHQLTLQVTKRQAPALTAAALFSMCPAYISRSTAGSFDNEGVAIFLLVTTFWLWLKAVDSGAMLHAALAALSYFAMVVSWGGYVFIINLIPLHVLALVLSGRYSPRVYIAYATFYPLATLLAMQVPFVGFNAITKAESAGSHAVFVGLQAFAAARWLHARLSSDQFQRLVAAALAVGGAALMLALVAAMAFGRLQWSGRSLTLLDPTYASKYIPIIASVGEHQPPSWGSFYLSLGPLLVLAPLGLFHCLDALDDGHLFMVLYAAFSFYFAGIMVRLLLTLAPAACFLSALGVSELMTAIARITKRQRAGGQHIEGTKPEDAKPSTPSCSSSSSSSSPSFSLQRKKKTQEASAPRSPPVVETPAQTHKRLLQEERAAQASFWPDVSAVFSPRLRFSARSAPDVPARALPGFLWLLLAAAAALLLVHMRHCMKVSHLAYSSTSMVFESRDAATRATRVHDDYREAYAWLRANAAPDAKVLGWWDYGYQLSALANRTVLVDNNTWNNTHIATVGRVLTAPESAALPMLLSLEVDFVFVLFGGRIGMHGDDLDKLPWILRIAQDVFPDDVLESEFTVHGKYVYDSENATRAMRESLLYKMSYFRFFDDGGERLPSVDKARSGHPRIDARGIAFDHLEEAFTSDAWIVRLFRVKRPRAP